MVFAAKVISGLGEVWQFLGFRGAVALALLVALPVHGCVEYDKGFDNGRTEVLEELRAAQAKAAETALKAAAQADEKALERAEAEAEVIERQLDAIERAEANDKNPLDALFN